MYAMAGIMEDGANIRFKGEGTSEVVAEGSTPVKKRQFFPETWLWDLMTRYLLA